MVLASRDRDDLAAFETEMRVLDSSAISLERDFRTHESIEKLSPVQGSAQYGLAGKRPGDTDKQEHCRRSKRPREGMRSVQNISRDDRRSDARDLIGKI